ncbi:autotransporter domain-containing protein [Devosia ginsengisoli]|uniref:Autotransporter domain-containing protein n=1 Tax=Devosia ginsengisoli TaxID=400770 RepID=A0A5B8LQY7_9HYPH|nr:autotransporter domain-containing protein [Devosia ginsengisoli]QDZ09902.1 autotransporter domain-containing protein [Devosia ginsengisoli]
MMAMVWRARKPRREYVCLLAMGLVALPVLPRQAVAACIPAGGTDYACSASNTAPQVIVADDANVSTNAGFSVDTTGTAANALDISGMGAITYTDLNGSPLTAGGIGLAVLSGGDIVAGSDGVVTIDTNGVISGDLEGISVVNEGTGATSITAHNTVTSANGRGVYAGHTNAANASTLSIDVQTVTGFHGIFAHNMIGAIDITAAGSVTATTGNGIVASNPFGIATGAVTINAEAVSGAVHGILIENEGTGATSLTATGSVVGTDGLGIHVSTDNAANTNGIVVNARDVSAGTDGISAQSDGTGMTSLTASGAVVGADGSGFLVESTNVANTGGVAINAQAVSGGMHGVVVYDSGLGASRIDAQGTVNGTAGSGIFVRSDNIGNLGGIDIDAVAVNGNVHGIYAENHGLGAATITATGDVTALVDKGIAIGNDHVDNIHAVTVAAQAVTGGDYGIYVNNSGRGVIDILAAGTVTATNGAGVVAWDSTATNTDGMTVQTQAVNGATDGIVVENVGTGATSVTASGAVVGTDRFGIIGVLTNAANASALAIDAQSVSGGVDGMRIRNAGTGATSIVASGAVVGTDGAGISSILGAGNSGGIAIDAQAVSGGTHGIVVYDPGLGAARIDAQGTVIGTAGSGVFIRSDNTANLGGVDIDAVAVSGNVHGIYAENHGLGATTITATGTVTAIIDKGIAVGNDHSGNLNAVTVNAQAVSGGNNGIFVNNQGQGAINIVAGGAVAASNGIGIEASNHAAGNTGGIMIDAQSVRSDGSGDAGIFALNNGSGLTDIAVGGLVEGSGGGIVALSANGAAIDISIAGEVRNLSQASQDIAIATTGGAAVIANTNRLLGVVQLGDLADSLSNAGTWNSAGGTNSFGAGMDSVTNQAGAALIAASLAGAVETTRFDGLEVFDSFGRVTLADGGASDRLEIDGNAVFKAGSVHAADTNATGAADLVLIAGSADIAGAVLDIANQGGYLPGQTFTVLTAAGGLSGEYAAITGVVQSAFLSLEDSYDANNAYLTVVQSQALSDVAGTPNQMATAAGLESLAPGHPVVSAVLALPDEDQARAAFDQLSGEIHGSLQTALLDNSGFVRDAMGDRLRARLGAPEVAYVPVLAYAPGATPILVAPERVEPVFWGQGFGAWGAADGDGNAAGLDRQSKGLLIGADGLLGDWRIGMLAGYGHVGFTAADRVSSGSSEDYHLGLYGGTEWGDFAFRAGLAHSWHDIGTDRAVAFPGFAGNATAQYGAGTLQAFGELGYGIEASGMRFEPFVNFAHVRLSHDGFTERGGAGALAVQGTTSGVTFATLGLRAEHHLALGTVEATLRGMVGWRHALGDTTPTSNHAFAGGSSFAIAGVPLARNSAQVEAALDLALTPNTSFSLAYKGLLSASAQDHGFTLGLAGQF